MTEEEDEEEEKIVDVPIKGIKKVYNTIYKFLQPEIYNEKLFNALKLPKTIKEKLDLLKEISFLFNAFNSIEDLKKEVMSKQPLLLLLLLVLQEHVDLSQYLL